MKNFLAVYIGRASALEKARWNELPEAERNEREKAGLDAWIAWGVEHAKSIVEQGGRLGKTKQVGPNGITDITNTLVGWSIVRAESHEAAAKLFERHPHFAIFPGDSVEIMEWLPLPAERG